MKPQTPMHLRFLAVRNDEAKPQTPAPTSPSFEQTLLALILAPLATGETAAAGYERKEHEVGTLFATLSAMESWTLHRRLSNPGPDDALAAAFNRMIAQRRARLLAFLGDPKRRAALAHARAS